MQHLHYLFNFLFLARLLSFYISNVHFNVLRLCHDEVVGESALTGSVMYLSNDTNM